MTTKEKAERANERTKKWYREHRERALAAAKARRNLPGARERRLKQQRAWCARNREKTREYSRKYRTKYPWKARAQTTERLRRLRDRYREKIVAFFGNCCIRCGFADIRALQLDHVEGAGKHYKHNGKKYPHRGVWLYRKILLGILPKEDFQLLCANCNWIKRWENHEAPGPDGTKWLRKGRSKLDTI